ncbi:MAG: DUF6768 family protein [Gemmatimonadota bacterium]
MTKSTKEIDVLIREALGQADADLFGEFGEQSLAGMATEVLRGRQRWIVGVSLVVGLVFLGLSVWSLVRFLGEPGPVGMLRWGALLFFSVTAVWAMKIWYWLEMNRKALAREIKRLELQVAQLAGALRRENDEAAT